jgi:hypothetical protein
MRSLSFRPTAGTPFFNPASFLGREKRENRIVRGQLGLIMFFWQT